MKNTIRSLSLLGISLMLALSVSAQDYPKVKENDRESKYKSEDLKVKQKRDEGKYKTDGLKVKDEKGEAKIKGRVAPMHRTRMERTEVKTGETQVQSKEEIAPVTPAVSEPATPEPAVVQQAPLPEPAIPVKKAPRYAAHKTVHHKAVASNKPRTRYVVRTKTVTDTVFVASPPEKVTETQYLHDTVTVTRVDTVLNVQKENTYTGYRVPRGHFKKVKLKKQRDADDVWMKTK